MRKGGRSLLGKFEGVRRQHRPWGHRDQWNYRKARMRMPDLRVTILGIRTKTSAIGGRAIEAFIS